MLLELTLLGLLIPSQGVKNERYALLHEQAEKNGWQVVRCSFRRARTFFFSKECYKVVANEQIFVISIKDGDTHLLSLLRDGFTSTAKELLKEAKIN